MASKRLPKKTVVQMDMNDDTIEIYASGYEAHIMTGITPSNISDVCNHRKKKTAKGYKWRFLNEYDNIKINDEEILNSLRSNDEVS